MKLKIYAEHLEAGVMEQMESAISMPFVVRGALMPDAHLGYSLPIGGVVATDGVVVPAWVGYDIGCGMSAMKLPLTTNDLYKADEILKRIYELVPVGSKTHGLVHEFAKPFAESLDPSKLSIRARAAFDKRGGFHHLGTLGGGNHFIEIGVDKRENVWVIIHSGSRGVGHGIATEYMKLASGTNKPKEGHYGFDVVSENGSDYINDMNWTLNFALANRRVMMELVTKAIGDVLGVAIEMDEESFINRNHNHATYDEKHDYWIHRKGATHAEKGMMGVIPGNMRDGSFIVCGLGNNESLCSSSHGAGRVMSRKKAKESITLEQFEEAMVGITATVKASTIDESPFAYKDIFEVMDLQKELVEVVEHIRPVINAKG